MIEYYVVCFCFIASLHVSLQLDVHNRWDTNELRSPLTKSNSILLSLTCNSDIHLQRVQMRRRAASQPVGVVPANANGDSWQWGFVAFIVTTLS
jgi:hypothetical protein